jgi:hypothetical protein
MKITTFPWLFVVAKRGPRAKKKMVGIHRLTTCHNYHGFVVRPFANIKHMCVSVFAIIIMKCTRPFTFWRLPHRRRSMNPRMVFISSLFQCLCNIFRVFYSWFIHSFYIRRLVDNVISRIEFVWTLCASVCLEEHSVASVTPFCLLLSFSKLLILIGILKFAFGTAECHG